MVMICSKGQHNQAIKRIKVQTEEGAIAAYIYMRLQVGIMVEKIHEFLYCHSNLQYFDYAL